MHSVSSKWRKPKKRLSKKMKERFATVRATRWSNDNQPNNQSVNNQTVEEKDYEFLLVHSSCWKELCKTIKGPVCNLFSITTYLSREKGLCAFIEFKCSACDHLLSECYSSPRNSDSGTERSFLINRRAVDAVNTVGLGLAALEKVCTVININCLSSRAFYNHLTALSTEVQQLEAKVLQETREKVRELHVSANQDLENTQILDVAVSYDGTWHRRGYKSLYGIGICIEVLSGLVVDFEIYSKYCGGCEAARIKYEDDAEAFSSWYAEHVLNKECLKNFEGSSGSMEVAAAKDIWSRSISKNQMRYTELVSDGDCKTWSALNELDPYKGVYLQDI